MKVAVIGASGFIGSHLTEYLVRSRIQVVAMSRRLPGLIPPDITNSKYLKLVEADIVNQFDLISALHDVDIVFHLASASLPQTSNTNPILDVNQNLVGGLNVLEAVCKSDVKRVVFASSGGTVYGLPSIVPIPENHPTNPSCAYGITKLALEKYFSLYEKLYGIKSIILRIANPYGERQRLESLQGVVPVFLSRALQHQPLTIFGDGSTVRDFLHVKDVVSALVSSINYEGKHRIFNIGSGTGTSLNKLISLIEQELDYSLSLKFSPARDFDVPTNVLCIQSARQQLSWSPKVSVEQGLSALCKYIKYS